MAPMPWTETLILMVDTPIIRGLLIYLWTRTILAAVIEYSLPPTGPEDPRWPRF